MATIDDFRTAYSDLDDVSDVDVSRALGRASAAYSASSYSATDLEAVILAQAAAWSAPLINVHPAPYDAALIRIVDGRSVGKDAEVAAAAASVPQWSRLFQVVEGATPFAAEDSRSFRLGEAVSLIGAVAHLDVPSTDGGVVVSVLVGEVEIAEITILDTEASFAVALDPAVVVAAGDVLTATVVSTGDEAADAAGLNLTLYGRLLDQAAFVADVVPEP